MNKQLTERLFLMIWLVSMFSISLLSNEPKVLANDPLELDGEFTSTTALFGDNRGVIHLRFPTAMILEEEAEVLTFSYYLDAEARIPYGLVRVSSAININAFDNGNENFTPYIVGNTTFDEFVAGYVNDTTANGQETILSQVELKIKNYRVVELVTLSIVKASIFIIDTPIPLIFMAGTFDHYSDVIRNTVFNMIVSLEVDWTAMFQPRNLSDLMGLSQPLSDLQFGVVSEQSLNPQNKMLSYPIEGQASDIFYVEAKLADSRSRATIILVDARGQRVTQIVGERVYGVSEDTYYSRLNLILRLPADGNYTLLVGILGNEWDYRTPQGGNIEFMYQKSQTLPFTGESPSGYVHAFIVDDASELSGIQVNLPDDVGQRQITGRVFDLSDEIMVSTNDASLAVRSLGTSGSGDGTIKITNFSAEGPILAVIHDNVSLDRPGNSDMQWNTETITITVDVK